jgi:hypothetical protein
LAVRIAVSLFLILFLGFTVSIGIQYLHAIKEPGKLEVSNMPPPNTTSMERKAGGGSRDYINFTNQITDKSSENALDSATQKSQNDGLVTEQNNNQDSNSSEMKIGPRTLLDLHPNSSNSLRDKFIPQDPH